MAPTNEAASATVATVATAGAAMYYLQNGEMLSSKADNGHERRSVAEKMAALTDEEIIAMFDEQIEIIENKAKEVMGGGIDYFLRHKTGAVVSGVIIIFLIVGWVVMRMRNSGIRADNDGKEKGRASSPKELSATATVDETRAEDNDEAALSLSRALFDAITPEDDEKEGCDINDEVESVPESVNTNCASDKSLEEEASSQGIGEESHLPPNDVKSIVTATTTRNKICIRTPIKNGVLRTPIRKKRVRKED